MGLVENIRRRLSVSPSPSSIRRHNASFPALSREEIDEILESPYETNYTYSESVAYKPHIGSREYIHPRLCRRFPATPSPKQNQNTPYPFLYNTWERYQSFNFSQTFLNLLRFIVIFSFTAVQFTFIQTFLYIYRFSRFITVNLFYYTIFAPILAPYYALRAYWYRAKFVWRTSQSIWTFVRWTWLWWTGQKVHDEFSAGVQTRSMASGGKAMSVQRKIVHQISSKRSNLTWLFLYLPLLFFLIWAGYHLHHWSRINEKGAIQPKEQLLKNDDLADPEYKMPKIKPSEQVPPHLAHPIGGPSLNVQEEAAESAHHQNPTEFGEIGGPFLPRFYQFIQPMSRFTEIAADFGHILAHGIEDIFLAFFTVIGQIGTAIFRALKETAIFIVQLPFRLFSFLWNWFFLPICNFLANSSKLIWDKYCSFANQISYFPRQLWNFIFDWIFTPIGNFASKIGSNMETGFQKLIVDFPLKIWNFCFEWILTPIGEIYCKLASFFANSLKNASKFIANLPSSIYSFLQNWLFSPIYEFFKWIGSSMGKIPEIISNPIGWTKVQFANLMEKCKNGGVEMAEWSKNKTGNLLEFVKNAATACFSFIFQFLKWIGQILLNSIFHIKNFILEMILNGFAFIGLTGEKMIDGLLWIKQGFLDLFGQIVEGIHFCAIKVFEYFTNLIDFGFEKCCEIYQKIVQFIWWTVKNVNSFVILVIKSVAQFSQNIYQFSKNTIINIWQKAREFEFPQQKPEQNQKIEPIKNILSSTGLGELPDDHPLLKRIRQIVLQALNEERHFVDYRIRKWVENNVLVMKSQLQKMEPKLVEETKEKMEADILPPPPKSDEEFKEEMRAEMEEKMQELMERGKAGHENELKMVEGEIDKKIRTFVAELSAQIRTHNSKIDKEMEEIKNKQKTFEEMGTKILERKESEPIVRQEKMTEKDPDGKEITKESTVLLQHIQRRMEEFDENALMERVRLLIKLELRRYDADRTGMPDYALESSGGSVLSTRCTVQYNERSRTQKLFGIPLWYTSYSPRTVIQRKGYGASAGECWAFYGGHGFLTIGLSKRINITAVSYEHLPMELSPDGHIRTAPKNFLVWSYQEVDDMNSRFLLGNFTYNARGEPLQIFPVQKWDPRFSQILELETLSNWGAPVTCLYRFRVHGDMMKVIPEAREGDVEFEALEAQHLSSAAHKSAKSVAEEQDRF